MSTPRDRLEAKRLYRRLNELFDTLDPERPLASMLDDFVTQLFEVLRNQLSLSAILLYEELHDGFDLVHQAGDLAEVPAERIDRNQQFLVELAENNFLLLYPGRNGPGSVHQSGLVQPDSAAAILVGEQPHRYLTLFVLDQGWVREDIEFSLNTVRVAFASRLVQERMRVTFSEAAAIQTSLLATTPPSFPGFDIAFRSTSATEVSGDFYDFIPFESEILGVAIGDASGHGLSAALLVRDVVTGLRMGIEKDMKVGYTFQKLNRVIHRSRLTSRFVSLFYGELEGNGNFIYINAGHEPPLLFFDDRVEELSAGGTVIGPLPEVRFKRGFAHLDRGATLVMMTDGILERRRSIGSDFGRERLIELVRAHEHESAAELVDRIFAAVNAFGHDQPWEDDATIVVVKRAARGR